MFSREDSNVLLRRLERSLEKTRTLSREDSNVLPRSVHCSLEKRALFSGEACTVLKIPFQGSFLDEKMTSFHASILSVLQPSFHVGNYLSVKHTYHTRSVGSIVLRVGYHNNGSAFVVEFL